MHRIVLAFVGAAGLFLVAPAARAAEPAINLDFLIGQKQLDDDDWDPLEDQIEFGVQTTWGTKDVPVGLAADLLYSSDSAKIGTATVKGSTMEIALGARAFFPVQQFHPYMGAGINMIRAEFSGNNPGVGSASDNDTAVGFWAGLGGNVRLGSNFNLGVALRYSTAEVTLFGTDGEAGGVHFGLTAGLGF